MIKKKPEQKEKDIEEGVSKPKDRMLWLRIPDALNKRFVHQCVRLSCGDGTVARMAIVKFIEEEEARERELNINKVK
jgi:hypothetical protein